MGTLRAAILLLAAALASAVFGVDAYASGRSLVVNEVVVAEFRAKVAGKTPEKTATASAQAVLAAPRGHIASTRKSGRTWQVQIGKRLVYSVTAPEAKARATSPDALAKEIASKLNAALALPPLSLEADNVHLAPGVQSAVGLVGSKARKAAMALDRTGVVTIARGQGKLTVKGLALGSVAVRFTAGPDSVTLNAEVLPPAARFPQLFEVEVMGNPATPSTIESTVRAVIAGRVGDGPGTRVQVTFPNQTPLPQGGSRSVVVHVEARSPGRYPASGPVRINIRNAGSSFAPESALWYSNDPENVDKTGRLYWASLSSATPARLLFHHRNRTSRPMAIIFSIVNTSDSEARVSAILGDSLPQQDPAKAGLNAAERYFRNYLSRSAEVFAVPARSTQPLTVRRLSPGETMSGLATLHLLGNSGPVLVVADALWAEDLLEQWRTAALTELPGIAAQPVALNGHQGSLEGEPTHVYPHPFREESFDFQVGGRFGFVRIGEKAITNSQATGALLGNFGVLYDIKGTLGNPTAAAVEVELVVEASAGYAGFLAWLNGEMLKPILLQPKQQLVLFKVTLEPGQTRRIQIKTLPLSGSNYPITLTARPVGVSE